MLVFQRGNQGGGGGGGMNNRNNMNNTTNSNYGYGSDASLQPMREEVSFAVPASKCGVSIIFEIILFAKRSLALLLGKVLGFSSNDRPLFRQFILSNNFLCLL